jgi:hypothetical protein
MTSLWKCNAVIRASAAAFYLDEQIPFFGDYRHAQVQAEVHKTRWQRQNRQVIDHVEPSFFIRPSNLQVPVSLLKLVGGLFKPDDQKALMLRIPMLSKTFARGDQQALLFNGLLPQLIVGHALIARSPGILYVMVSLVQLAYCGCRDILFYKNFHTAFSSMSIVVICSSAKDAA